MPPVGGNARRGAARRSARRACAGAGRRRGRCAGVPALPVPLVALPPAELPLKSPSCPLLRSKSARKSFPDRKSGQLGARVGGARVPEHHEGIVGPNAPNAASRRACRRVARFPRTRPSPHRVAHFCGRNRPGNRFPIAKVGNSVLGWTDGVAGRARDRSAGREDDRRAAAGMRAAGSHGHERGGAMRADARRAPSAERARRAPEEGSQKRCPPRHDPSTVQHQLNGGPRRTRTDDPRIKSPMLYQLS